MAYEVMKNGTIELIRFSLGRTFTSIYGLAYMIIGILMPIVMIVTILSSLKTADSAAVSLIIYITLPAFIPLFATIGGLGVTYLFSTDRSSGVYEYLIATRKIKVRDIFVSFAIADIAVVAIILGIDLTALYLFVHLKFASLLSGLLKMVLVFSIPVAIFSSLISSLAMLTWSSLSKTYPGVNSPGGIGAIIGVVPPLVFLFVGQSGSGLDQYLLGGIFSVILFGLFITLLVVVIRNMSNERMIT